MNALCNKIKQLQHIINESIHELNQGVDNIQIANQLDNEVKTILYREIEKVNSFDEPSQTLSLI